MVDNVSIDDTVGAVVDALYDVIERPRSGRRDDGGDGVECSVRSDSLSVTEGAALAAASSSGHGGDALWRPDPGSARGRPWPRSWRGWPSQACGWRWAGRAGLRDRGHRRGSSWAARAGPGHEPASLWAAGSARVGPGRRRRWRAPTLWPEGQGGAMAMLRRRTAGSLMAGARDVHAEADRGRRGPPGVIDIDAPVADNLHAVADAYGRSRRRDSRWSSSTGRGTRTSSPQIRRCRRTHQAHRRRRRLGRYRAAVRGHRRRTCTSASAGSTEGIITAAALRCLGGEIAGPLLAGLPPPGRAGHGRRASRTSRRAHHRRHGQGRRDLSSPPAVTGGRGS